MTSSAFSLKEIKVGNVVAVDAPPAEEVSKLKKLEQECTPQTSQRPSGSSRDTSNNSDWFMRQRRLEDNLVESIGKRLDLQKVEDRFVIYGKHVAAKLRDVRNSQRAFARNIIKDALLKASRGKLKPGSRIVTKREVKKRLGHISVI